MTQVKPFIRCIDFWLEGIPDRKLEIYKELIAEGQILKHHVLVNKQTHATTVEYYAIAPHEWILQEMARRL